MKKTEKDKITLKQYADKIKEAGESDCYMEGLKYRIIDGLPEPEDALRNIYVDILNLFPKDKEKALLILRRLFHVQYDAISSNRDELMGPIIASNRIKSFMQGIAHFLEHRPKEAIPLLLALMGENLSSIPVDWSDGELSNKPNNTTPSG